jgi:hypothetical protein
MMAIVRSRGFFLPHQEETYTPEDEEHLVLINRLAQKPLSRDQVYIRSMYLCSNQMCDSDWCRFSPIALEQIREKVVGQSVLAGHDRKSLPVARFFKATLVERAEVPDLETGLPTQWIRAWFYWLKETTGAQDLALNMDGGIYREVSISWRYRGGRCSICEQHPRSCEHIPGGLYEGHRCYVWIDEILDVLEGSLVYRGADRETGITGEHGMTSLPENHSLERILRFENEILFRA